MSRRRPLNPAFAAYSDNDLWQYKDGLYELYISGEERTTHIYERHQEVCQELKARGVF